MKLIAIALLKIQLIGHPEKKTNVSESVVEGDDSFQLGDDSFQLDDDSFMLGARLVT